MYIREYVGAFDHFNRKLEAHLSSENHIILLTPSIHIIYVKIRQIH